MGKKKLMLGGICVAVVVLGIIIGSLAFRISKGKSKTVYDTNIIASQMRELSELVTLEYKYKNAAKAETPPQKIFGAIDVPFTGNSVIVCYEGTIKMGTDLSKAKIEVSGNSIDVELVPCEIISHEIDEDSWEYLDISSSLFSPLTLEDGDELRKSQKDLIEKSVLEEGLLDEASEKAVGQMKTFLKTLYPDAAISIIVK